MSALILTIHIIVCVCLITLVLLQSGKEGMGVIFGGSSGTVFGSSGAGGILVKLTAFIAAIFLITSLTFTYMSGQGQKEPRESIVLEESGQPESPGAVPKAGNGADQGQAGAVDNSEK